MKRSFHLHSGENLLSRFAWVTILALATGTAAFVGYAQQGSQNLSGAGGGGGVHGSISAQLKVQIGPVLAGASVIRDLALPDFEVFLQNVDTGETSQPVSTDLMGRYAFPSQKPGSYQLHWKQQGGWQEGVLDKQIVITNSTAYPGTAEVKPVAGQGLVAGQLKRADGKPTWVYEEFFGLNLTPKVEALDADGKSVGGPVRANAAGQFAIAGLPKTSLQLQAKIEAALAVQAVPATAISVDGSVSPVTMTFNEHGPEIVSVEAKVGQKAVASAAPGSTVTVSVDARSPDQRILKFDWRLQEGMGKLESAGASADWTLPTEPGNYAGYVMVSDGFGGYTLSSFGVPVGISSGVSPSSPLQGGTEAGKVEVSPAAGSQPAPGASTTCLSVILDDTALAGDSASAVSGLVGSTIQAKTLGGTPVGTTASIGAGQHQVQLTGLPVDTDLQLTVSFNGAQSPGFIFETAPRSPVPRNIIHTVAGADGDCQSVKLTQFPNPASVATSFLNFIPANVQTNYYGDVDPQGLRTGSKKLGDWWSVNGFDSSGRAPGEVRTSYLNNNDLGSGRDMHFLRHNDGTVSAYVTNYVDMIGGMPFFSQNPAYADSALAHDLTRQAATVCMEWSPVEGTSNRIVKFFVYGGGGAGAPSISSLPLDAGGPKFVPQLCAYCHGGSYTPGNPDMGASFREFDLTTFKFPGGRDVPNDGERAAFKQQNLIVRSNSTDNISVQAIKNLINGWYGIPQTNVDPHPTFTGQYSNWFPPGLAATGWDDAPGASSDTRTSHRYLYRSVVAKSCRTCHVAFGPGLDWTTFGTPTSPGFSTFKSNIAPGPASFVFGPSSDVAPTTAMPHSFVTYKNFWSSRNPSESQILTLFTGW
jgi:hypothetical protein